MIKLRKGDRVTWSPAKARKYGSGVIPDKVYHGVVDSQTKSGNRNSVWVRFDTKVTGAGTNLYMTPIRGLTKVKARKPGTTKK